ncbi:MAG: hypothetical protein ACRBM6_01425, partial [Geminicoccales bacterium]
MISAMVGFRYATLLLAASVLSAPALAKDETLADRGKRMCEEAGVPLWECTILPPDSRPSPPAPVQTAAIAPELQPFGTGKYGWCDDCTSLIAAAPVEPWSKFGGWTRSKPRDESDRGGFADASDSVGSGGGGGTSGGGDGGG